MSAIKHGAVVHSRFADIVEKNENRYTGERIERSGGGV